MYFSVSHIPSLNLSVVPLIAMLIIISRKTVASHARQRQSPPLMILVDFFLRRALNFNYHHWPFSDCYQSINKEVPFYDTVKMTTNFQSFYQPFLDPQPLYLVE